MKPEMVQLGDSIRPVTRYRPQVGTSSAVWWCPFCDHSNQEGLEVCGNPLCGARMVATPEVRVEAPAKAGPAPVARRPVKRMPVKKGGKR